MRRLVCAVALLSAARASGDGLPEAAVLQVLQAKGASVAQAGDPVAPGVLAGATEALRVGVERSGRFHPVPTHEQAARLSAHMKSRAQAGHAGQSWPACAAQDDSSPGRGAVTALDAHLACAAATGTLLGVAAVVVGAIERAPDETVIALRRIDVVKGQIDAVVQERAPLALSDAELRSQLLALGRRLAIAPAHPRPLESAHPADEAASARALDGPRAMELVAALAGAGVKPIYALRRGRRYALPSLSCEPPPDGATAAHAEPTCSLPVHGRAANALLVAIRNAGADRGGARLTDLDCDVMAEQAHCTFVPH